MTAMTEMTSAISARVHEVRRLLNADPQLGQAHDPAVRVQRIGPLQFRAVDDAGRAVASDLPSLVGGADEHMTPGTLLRAALGCCDATALAIEAAARGIELSRLEVSVESDSDHRGLLGFPDVDPGPLSVQVHYRLGSANATHEQLHALVEHAEQHSPVLSALRRQVPVQVDLQLD